jgi:hypothetical protein
METGINSEKKYNINQILSGKQLCQFRATAQCLRDVLCLHHQGNDVMGDCPCAEPD